MVKEIIQELLKSNLVLDFDILQTFSCVYKTNKEIYNDAFGSLNIVHKDHVSRYEFFSNCLYLNEIKLNFILSLVEKDYFLIRNIKILSLLNTNIDFNNIEKVYSLNDKELEWTLNNNHLIIPENLETIKVSFLYLSSFLEDIKFKKVCSEFYQITNIKITTHHDIY